MKVWKWDKEYQCFRTRLIIKLSFKLTFWTWIEIKLSYSHFQLDLSQIAHIFNLTRLNSTENWVNLTRFVKNLSLMSRKLNIEIFPIFDFYIIFLHYLLIESHEEKHEERLIKNHDEKHEEKHKEKHKENHDEKHEEKHKEEHEESYDKKHKEKHREKHKENIKRNMKRNMMRNMMKNMKKNMKKKHEDCLTLIESHNKKTW